MSVHGRCAQPHKETCRLAAAALAILTANFIGRQVSDNESGNGPQTVSTGDVVQTVAGNPNAIGYASIASVSDNVKAVGIEDVMPTKEAIQDGDYKVQRNFVLVTRKDEALSKAAQDFFDFATSEAADDLITEAGAVPVKR